MGKEEHLPFKTKNRSFADAQDDRVSETVQGTLAATPVIPAEELENSLNSRGGL